MIKIQSENIVCYDVDDTLVLWDDLFRQPHQDVTGQDTMGFLDPNDNSINHLIPHYRHVSLLKKHHGRGLFVIVWSAAGVEWANSVIKTLGIEDCVDLVMTKPSKYVDDLMANEILGSRIYLKSL